MRNIWFEIAFVPALLLVISLALLLAGCAVVKNEPNKVEAVALGGACAANVQADSYQVACASSGAEKVVQAIREINSKVKK